MPTGLAEWVGAPGWGGGGEPEQGGAGRVGQWPELWCGDGDCGGWFHISWCMGLQLKGGQGWGRGGCGSSGGGQGFPGP